MALSIEYLARKYSTKGIEDLAAKYAPKASTLPLPTAEQEALQHPGNPGLKGAVQNFFDPGVLLDPFNLAAGAGAGLKTGVGALRGIGQAASGLYGPLIGFGRGFIKGLREPFPQPMPKPAAPPPQPEPTGSYSSETGTRSAKHTSDGPYVEPAKPPEKPSFAKTPTGKYVEVKPKPEGPTLPQLAGKAVQPVLKASKGQKPPKPPKPEKPPKPMVRTPGPG